MKRAWSELILKNFGEAATTYNQEAELQRTFAWRLAEKCSRESIPEGIWVDLGAGTGLLAEALETLNPSQSVLRVDASKEMLDQHRSDRQTQLWDLNLGLPNWPNQPALIASSFALHWLNAPTSRIEEWVAALTPGGLLAIALPVKGSFKEWHFAANLTGVPCTAIELPCHKDLLKVLDPTNIRYQKLHCFTQKASGVNSLLKPIVKVGAQTSQKVNLSIGEWRRLQKAWPCSRRDKTVSLTWLIQLLLIQR